MVESETHAYLSQVRAVLAHPERAARLADLEASCAAAATAEDRRAVSVRIGALLDEVFDEVDAVRRAVGKPVPQRGGCPPSSAGE